MTLLLLYFMKQQEIRCWQTKQNHKLVKRDFNFGCLSHIYKRPWSWSVTCVMINYYLQSVVLTGFVLFSHFFLSVKVLVSAKWLNINQISGFSSFSPKCVCLNKYSGCFVRQLVSWFPAMFCNAKPSHCFLAKKWSTYANSKERIGLNFYINCWEFSC